MPKVGPPLARYPSARLGESFDSDTARQGSVLFASICDVGHTRNVTPGVRPSMLVSDRLTGLDSSFLHLERGGTQKHVASTTLFQGPAPPYVEFRDHIESRLPLVPRFRQKVRFVPFGQGRPVWVDDPHLNLTYHVRHTSLPEPGSEQQLRVLAARIFS